MKRDLEKKIWMLLLVVSLILRLVGLENRAMSHDESLHALYSWNLSHGLNYNHHPMMHGPLLFHLNGLVYALFTDNDSFSRLVPALWGSACVGMLYFFRRWLGSAGALCASLLLCVEPGHLYYSRYLRNDITVSFFTLLMGWAILDYRETRKNRSLILLGSALGFQFVTKETCFIVGAVLGAACVGFGLRESLQRRQVSFWKILFSHPLIHCAVLMLLLALPFAGALLHPLLGWDPLDNQSAEGQRRILGIAGGILMLSTACGVWYFNWQKHLGAFAKTWGLFWGLQLLLYTTLLRFPVEGLASGMAGSLGYWLAQHDVQRGNPDPFFYVTLLLLYTPVLIAGALLSLRKFTHWPMSFLWFWFLGSLLIYSWAGERMPWLLLHISLPLCIMTGTMLPPLFAAPGRKTLKVIIALGCFQLVSNSLRVNGPLAEGPWEPLMYAHSGPDIKTSLLLIEEHLAKHPEGRLLVDNHFAWPLAWYFRNGGVSYTSIETENIAGDVRALIVRPDQTEALEALGWHNRLRVDMTTWPRPQYHRIDLENLDGLLRIPAVRKKFWRYYLFRDQPEWGEHEWPGPSRYVLMTRASL
jgi:uncharacterized protein (TIGR03663 family)